MNRYSNIRPTDLNLPVITLPLEQLNNNLGRTQQLYDSSKNLANVPIQYIQENSEHSAEAGKLKKQLDAVSNEVAKRYAEGNVEEANRYALSTIKNVGKEFAQGGRGYALADAYNSYNKGLQSIYDLNKDVPGGDINTAVAVDEYKKGIQALTYQDGLGHTHNVSSNPRAYKYFNRSKSLYEAVKQFDPDVTEQDFIGLMDQNGNLDTKNQAWISRLKTKGFSSERINNIFNAVASDPSWQQQAIVEAKYKVLSSGEEASKNEALAHFEKKADALVSILDYYRDNNRGEFNAAVTELGIDVNNKTPKEVDLLYSEWKASKKESLMQSASDKSAVELLVDADYDMQKSKFTNLLPKEKSLNYLTNQVYENNLRRNFDREENARTRKNAKDIVMMEINAKKEESMPLFINGGLVDISTDPKLYENANNTVTNWEKGDKELSTRLWRAATMTRPSAGGDDVEREVIAAMNNSNSQEEFKALLAKSSNNFVKANVNTFASRYESLKMPIGDRNTLEQEYIRSKDIVNSATSVLDPDKAKSSGTFQDMYGLWSKYNKGKTFNQFIEEGKKGKLNPEHFKGGMAPAAHTTGRHTVTKTTTYDRFNNPNEEFSKASREYFRQNPKDFKYSRNTMILGDANTDSKLGKMAKSFTDNIANTWTLRTQKGRSTAGIFVDRQGNTLEPEYWVPVYSAPNDSGDISIVLQNKDTKARTTIEVEAEDYDTPTINVMLSNARAEAANRGDLNSFIQISAGMRPMENESLSKKTKYFSGSDGKSKGIYNATNLGGGSISYGYQTVYKGGNGWSLVIDKNGDYFVGKESVIHNQTNFMAVGVEGVSSSGLQQSNRYFTTKDFTKAKNMIQTLESSDDFQYIETIKK